MGTAGVVSAWSTGLTFSLACGSFPPGVSHHDETCLTLGYKTEEFWLGYPHIEMPWGLKTYYLLQAAYWCQQTIILALKIEKPRKDFKELVAHVGGV